MRSIALAVSIGLAITGAALAQSRNQPPAGKAGIAGAGDSQRLMRDRLQQAGFTDVEIGPDSFVVRAKDLQGRQVTMVIARESAMPTTNGSGAESEADTSPAVTTGSAVSDWPESEPEMHFCHLLPLASDHCS